MFEHTDRIADGYAAEDTVDAALAPRFPEYRSRYCAHGYNVVPLDVGGETVDVCGGCGIAIAYLA